MSAPTETRALAALNKVQALSAKELDAAITAEIGDPALGVMVSLAKAVLPKASKEQLDRTVHLMVLSYLMRVEAER